ncbi:hypothetical protein BC834DRAFT_409913 [Gloeopeniophorella convolvens]|nr:hypothetical protein BC834DRAFT_409913 [Gloeopeniophorella convolvens]
MRLEDAGHVIRGCESPSHLRGSWEKVRRIQASYSALVHNTGHPRTYNAHIQQVACTFDKQTYARSLHRCHSADACGLRADRRLANGPPAGVPAPSLASRLGRDTARHVQERQPRQPAQALACIIAAITTSPVITGAGRSAPSGPSWKPRWRVSSGGLGARGGAAASALTLASSMQARSPFAAHGRSGRVTATRVPRPPRPRSARRKGLRGPPTHAVSVSASAARPGSSSSSTCLACQTPLRPAPQHGIAQHAHTNYMPRARYWQICAKHQEARRSCARRRGEMKGGGGVLDMHPRRQWSQ